MPLLTRTPARGLSLLACGLLTLTLAAGCHDHDKTVNVFPPSGPDGILASDLQTLDDYLNLPEVQEIFANMDDGENFGGPVPDLAGQYFTGDQQITFTTIPGFEVGEDLADTQICFGDNVDGVLLDFQIEESSFVDVGAAYFIEGNNIGGEERFTIYVAHVSRQVGSSGRSCEIHLVRIFAGARAVDGTLSELQAGLAVIGLIGDCDNLLVGDVQVSSGTASRIGPGCNLGPLPVDPSQVLVRVENFLNVPIDVFTSTDGFDAPVEMNASEAVEFEEPPGFELLFESLPANLKGTPIGESLFKFFEPDTAEAGESVTYVITNDIDGNLFFNPIVNVSSAETTSLIPFVNRDIFFDPPCTFCPQASLDPGDVESLGYYEYDIVHETPEGDLLAWTPADVSIHFYQNQADLPDAPVFVIDSFEDPGFEIELDTGSIEVFVPEDGRAIP